MRRSQLDFLRVTAMFAVIAIHVSSGYIAVETIHSVRTMNLAFVINQASRFAVPLFLLVSGLALQLSAKPLSCAEFLARRFHKVIVPYLFWCLIYYLYNNHHSLSWHTVSPSAIVKSILTGNLAPHLYFIVILAQLYLIFPLLKSLLAKSAVSVLLVSFFMTFALQEMLYLRNFSLYLIPVPLRAYIWLLFPTWLFYFVLGMYLSSRFDSICELSAKYKAIILPGTVIFAFLFLCESYATLSYDSSMKPMIICYTVLAFLSIVGASKGLARSKPLNTAVEVFSKGSMTIYFSHVLFLNLLRHISFFSTGYWGMLLLYCSVVLTSLTFSLLFDGCLSFVKRRLALFRPAGG